MDIHGSVGAPIFGSLSSSESLERVPLGMRNSPIHIKISQGSLADWGLIEDDSEVYKARSKRSRSVMALKKILMHNEKDGVSFRFNVPEVLADLGIQVPYYGLARDKAPKNAITSEYSAPPRDGCRA